MLWGTRLVLNAQNNFLLFNSGQMIQAFCLLKTICPSLKSLLAIWTGQVLRQLSRLEIYSAMAIVSHTYHQTMNMVVMYKVKQTEMQFLIYFFLCFTDQRTFGIQLFSTKRHRICIFLHSMGSWVLIYHFCSRPLPHLVFFWKILELKISSGLSSAVSIYVSVCICVCVFWKYMQKYTPILNGQLYLSAYCCLTIN